VNADSNVLILAHAILDKYNLSPRDSIHVATAVEKKIKTFISDDKDLDQVKEITRIPLG